MAIVHRTCNICHSNAPSNYREYARLGDHKLLKCVGCGLIYLDQIDNLEVDVTAGSYPIESLYLPLEQLYLRKAQGDLRYICRETSTLLDVGFGIGTFVRCALERGWDAWGVEPNLRAVEFAHASGIDRVLPGTLDTADLHERHFDAITLFGVIEHVVDPARLIAQIKELLKPGGLFVLQTPTSDGLFHKIARATYLLSGGGA